MTDGRTDGRMNGRETNIYTTHRGKSSSFFYRLPTVDSTAVCYALLFLVLHKDRSVSLGVCVQEERTGRQVRVHNSCRSSAAARARFTFSFSV